MFMNIFKMHNAHTRIFKYCKKKQRKNRDNRSVYFNNKTNLKLELSSSNLKCYNL